MHHFLSVSFGSLLSTIVHLLLDKWTQIYMRSALFSLICSLPVFKIGVYKNNLAELKLHQFVFAKNRHLQE